VIGVVLIPGGRAPWLIRRNILPNMHKGSVIVDVAVDQGGCVETTRETTHNNPTYEIDGVVHYCVANMPGAVPRTSTFALNNQTAVYTLRLANEGLDALRKDLALQYGLNTYHGFDLFCRSRGFWVEIYRPRESIKALEQITGLNRLIFIVSFRPGLCKNTDFNLIVPFIMRKTIINPTAENIPPSNLKFLDLEQLTQVEITSESQEYPIESALTEKGGTGWQAAQPGEQTICLIFDQPLDIKHIHLIFAEQEQSRTQEFVLLWQINNEDYYREILRQQFHFSPPATTREIEDYNVNLNQLKALKLTIIPNIDGSEAFAKLKQLRLA
jgi:hypothetical protein